MERISPVNKNETSGKAKDLLDAVESKVGSVPNFFLTLAQSPYALETYLGMSESLGGGALSAGIREQIAIAVAAENNCDYCLAAHTTIGGMVGLDQESLTAAQSGRASNAKDQAILDIALELNANHGHPGSGLVDKAHENGITDEELFEIVANVAQNILSNSINGIADTNVDFPQVTNVKQAAE